VRIRAACRDDAAAIADIYAPYVNGTAISLEDEAPGAPAMAERVAAGGALYPWLVAEDEGGIIGYASSSRFRPRPGYRFTVETSVYVAADRHGRGGGRALYENLLETLVAQGFAQAIAAITLPNQASMKLHEAMGFRPCGVYAQVGWKLGRWWDVGLWQRPLAAVATPPAEPRPLPLPPGGPG
jgi:phosphinothricin acetyltransferase